MYDINGYNLFEYNKYKSSMSSFTHYVRKFQKKLNEFMKVKGGWKASKELYIILQRTQLMVIIKNQIN